MLHQKIAPKKKNDKYYTPINIANHCWEIIDQVIGLDNITEIIDPASGDGAFWHYKRKPDLGIDLEPEFNNDCIVKGDFLTCPLDYKQGRLILTNPPFGLYMTLARNFYKKAITLGDYIGFILPISQLNNIHSLYEFDLIYSEDLKPQNYSDILLHCCFNIYQRPAEGIHKHKQKTQLKDISLIKEDHPSFKESTYDIRILRYGCHAGRLLNDDEPYTNEYKIIINKPELKEEVVKTLQNVNWYERIGAISILNIQKRHIYDLLREKIPNIK